MIVDRDTGKLVQLIAGESGVGQISTGAGIALGAALLDNDGDTTNVSGTGGNSAASAVSGSTIISGGG